MCMAWFYKLCFLSRCFLTLTSRCTWTGTFVLMEESSVKRTMCSSLSSCTSWSPSLSWKSACCRALLDSSSTYSSMHHKFTMLQQWKEHLVLYSYFSALSVFVVLNLFSFQIEKKNCSHRMISSCLGGHCMSSMRRSFTLKPNILVSTGFQSRSLTLVLDVQCPQKNITSCGKIPYRCYTSWEMFLFVLHLHKRESQS